MHSANWKGVFMALDAMTGKTGPTETPTGIPQGSQIGVSGGTEPVTSRIAQRLVFSLVVVSSVITFFLTIFQLALDYRSETSSLNTQIDQIKTVHIQSLIQSVWTFDDEQINTQLNGFSQFPEIVYAAVTIGGEVAWSAGLPESKKIHRRNPVVAATKW
jgi:hypothetical protein